MRRFHLKPGHLGIAMASGSLAGFLGSREGPGPRDAQISFEICTSGAARSLSRAGDAQMALGKNRGF